MNPAGESVEKGGSDNQIEVRMRPSRVLVQKRNNLFDGLLWLLSPRFHPALALHFGDLNNLLARDTQLKDQRLCIQGSEKDEIETLQMSCSSMKDLSKLLLMCCPTSKGTKKTEQLRIKDDILKACAAVSEIRSEVDKLSERVSSLQASIKSGKKVDEKEFMISTELLMVQLLKLDGIEAEGEAKAQRKSEVQRIQSYVDKLDALKAKTSNDS